MHRSFGIVAKEHSLSLHPTWACSLVNSSPPNLACLFFQPCMSLVPFICSVNLSGVVRCSPSRRLLFFFSCHCCSRRRLRVAAAGLLLFLFCTAADRSTTSSSSFSSQAGMSLSYREIIECRYIGLFSISKKTSYRTSNIKYLDIDLFCVFPPKILRKFQNFS